MNREERLLLWSSNIWYFGAGLFGPLFAVFTERIGGDIFSITSVWSAYLITMGVLVIIFGRISDRSYAMTRRMILTGYFLNAVFTFCYLFVSNPRELLILQMGMGLATALASPTWSALYEKFSVKGKEGYAWGLSAGWENIATGVAIFVGGNIVSRLSFDELFFTMGCVQSLAFLVQLRMFRKRKKK